jgi:hypothetical protein
MEISGFDWDSGNWPKCGKHGVSREQIERLFLEGRAQVAPDLKHSTPTESATLRRAGWMVGQCSWLSPFGQFHPPDQRPLHAREGDQQP